MPKIIFNQVRRPNGNIFSYAELFPDAETAKAELEERWTEGAPNQVTILGAADYERHFPKARRIVEDTPTDSEDPDAAKYAIQLDYPSSFSEKAKGAIAALEGAEACYYYMESFIITNEGCDLSKDVRWQGDTLEEMECWLEEQADLMGASPL